MLKRQFVTHFDLEQNPGKEANMSHWPFSPSDCLGTADYQNLTVFSGRYSPGAFNKRPSGIFQSFRKLLTSSSLSPPLSPQCTELGGTKPHSSGELLWTLSFQDLLSHGRHTSPTSFLASSQASSHRSVCSYDVPMTVVSEHVFFSDCLYSFPLSEPFPDLSSLSSVYLRCTSKLSWSLLIVQS